MSGNTNKNKLNILKSELNQYKLKGYISRSNKLEMEKLEKNIKNLENKIESNKLNRVNLIINQNLKNGELLKKTQLNSITFKNTNNELSKLKRQNAIYFENTNTNTNNESLNIENSPLEKLHKNFINYLNKYIKNHPENNINIEEIKASFNKQFETAKRKLNNFNVNSNSLQKEANKANRNANIFRRKSKLSEN
jgi:hypothetical protein